MNFSNFVITVCMGSVMCELLCKFAECGAGQAEIVYFCMNVAGLGLIILQVVGK